MCRRQENILTNMTQGNLISLAKQGNPGAIAALMNRQLQPKDITAKATLKDGCLQVILESSQAPPQEVLNFVRKGMTELKAEGIRKVKVSAWVTGASSAAWIKAFEIPAPMAEEPQNPPTPVPEPETIESINTAEPAHTSSPLVKVSGTYQSGLPKIEKNVPEFLQPNEYLMGILSGRYQAKNCFLLLTNQRLACFAFSFFNDKTEKCFLFSHEKAKIVAFQNALKITPSPDTELKFYFDDDKLAKEFVDESLSHVVKTLEKDESILPLTKEERTSGCVSCFGLIGIVWFISVILTQCFGGGTTSVNEDVPICVGDACWRNEEHLIRDVCRHDPSLEGCEKYR